jgi:predicted HD superfamily hydrolase involved in NAD metabolism
LTNQRTLIEGVPAGLTLEAAREWVRPRVTERRFKHIEGVAYSARELAKRAGCDAFMAELAGWLHDCCKEIKDTELVQRAREFGLTLHPVEVENGHLLHGPVGAQTARAELGLTNQLILDAMSQHTLGEVGMTTLAEVVFLADCIEPNRPADCRTPIWNALTGASEGSGDETAPKQTTGNELDLALAILIACDLGLRDLLTIGRTIHPKTVDVRNHYLKLIQARRS